MNFEEASFRGRISAIEFTILFLLPLLSFLVLSPCVMTFLAKFAFICFVVSILVYDPWTGLLLSPFCITYMHFSSTCVIFDCLLLFFKSPYMPLSLKLIWLPCQVSQLLSFGLSMNKALSQRCKKKNRSKGQSNII